MATRNVSFGAEVANWVDRTTETLTDVFHEATANIISLMSTPVQQGGPLPYKTGNLRRSLWVSTRAMPTVSGDNRALFEELQDYTAVIVSAPIGSTIYAGFRAPYALRLNYGFVGEDSLGRFYNQSGYGFVDMAALSWPAIVAAAIQTHRRS